MTRRLPLNGTAADRVRSTERARRRARSAICSRIHRLHSDGVPYREIAEECGVSTRTAHAIATGARR